MNEEKKCYLCPMRTFEGAWIDQVPHTNKSLWQSILEVIGRYGKKQHEVSVELHSHVEIHYDYGYSNRTISTLHGCDPNYHFDLCPWCFKDKLVPFLESQKTKPTV